MKTGGKICKKLKRNHENLANFMHPKRTDHSQGLFFEKRLSSLLNPHHRLLLLAELIDWEELETGLSLNFEEAGAPAKPVRLIAGIFMLQHMSALSDEAVVRCWVENPYWQAFCGYDYLQWTFPVHPSSLSIWRKRLGETGIKKILQATLRCAIDGELIRASEMSQVNVDTTVMPKNITYPTDAKLYYRSLRALVRLAGKYNVPLRQTYTFLAKRALRNCSQYAHARKMKASRREKRRLHTFLGRVLREVHRAVDTDKELMLALSKPLEVIQQIHDQKRNDKDKVYSVHEPEVRCIAKGKAHKKYEFGCKVSIVTTRNHGLVLSSQALHTNPFDGHTLKSAIASSEELSGVKVKRATVDKGYRGHGLKDIEVLISGTRKLSRHFRNLLKRRQAIEPVIGHMKSDGKLDRNFLKGTLGDSLNAILCGIGHNIRWLLKRLVPEPHFA